MGKEKKLKNKIENDTMNPEREDSPKKGKKRRKKILKVVLLSFLGLFLVAGIWFYFSYGRYIVSYQEAAKAYVASCSSKTFRKTESSLVYASNGELISVLKGEKDLYYLSYQDIPEIAINAMIVTEDRKFRKHKGYDIYAIFRAFRALIINRGEVHQGASTITQQLARTTFLTNEVTFERKITEIFIASELEKKFSKDQILEFYMNNIYFANGYYGIQAAANGYFGKSAGELSLSQITFLCAIPNNPTLYNPIRFFSNTMERRNKVLDQMYDAGMISTKALKKAKKEAIVFSKTDLEKQDYAETYSYFCAIRALMKQEGFVFRTTFSNKEDKEIYEANYYDNYYRVQKSLFVGGYRIYTSIDLEKQELLQNTINDVLQGYTATNEEGTYQLQASGVCIDNDTGRVTAIIGGRGQETSGYTLNRAYQSKRQPGSAIKPLIVYTPVFERGNYPDTLVIDEKFEGGPKNSSGVYSGEITIRKAVESSKNTVAWKLFEHLSPVVGLEYLLNMNFSDIVDTDYVPAASLGGFTYGASALEMTSAYAALENEGIYREPTCIVRIMDADGNEVVGDFMVEKPVYQRNAALMMTDVLQGVMTQGTGSKLALSNMPSAGKTGTTNDQKDGWFVGYTKYYTTGVWVGYDMPKPLETLMGNTYPGTIWKRFMDKIHMGLEPFKFNPYIDNRPPQVTEIPVDPISDESDVEIDEEDRLPWEYGDDEIGTLPWELEEEEELLEEPIIDEETPNDVITPEPSVEQDDNSEAEIEPDNEDANPFEEPTEGEENPDEMITPEPSVEQDDNGNEDLNEKQEPDDDGDEDLNEDQEPDDDAVIWNEPDWMKTP